MAYLTKEEKAWVRKVQKLLDQCPSTRIGGFTIGDYGIWLYDRTFESQITEIQDKSDKDFCTAVHYLDAGLGELKFTFAVHSTAG